MSCFSVLRPSIRRRPLLAMAALLPALVLAPAACGGQDPLAALDRVAPTTVAPPTTTTAPAPVTVAPKPAHRPAPSPPPCAANADSQLVLVSLRSQHLWMCAHHRLAYSTPITSGMTGPDTATPTGRYRIQGLNRDSVLTLTSGAKYNVKYWIPFDAPLFGFHDSSWQKFPYGADAYRTGGSHGCVHMPLAAIKFLYTWADIGTAVKIRT